MCRLASALSLVGLCFAASVSAGNAAPSFETDVRPILKAHCFQCHGEEPEVQGNLDVRLVRLMQQGGDSGAAIVPDKPEESLLYQRLHDGEMPPDESKLISQDELRTIRDWIAAGAKTLRPEPERIGDEPFITEEEKSHWAFQPIRRVSVPQPAGADRIANPIDAFLLQRLEAKGLTFSPPASPRTLIRRLSLDLLGLPPEPDWIAEFLQDSRTQDGRDVWSATVDRLLQSPHYGERWARHWLDVAGYADSEGYNDVDAVRPDAWRYRDYVIDAMNADLPFDQFITEQLAGDELVTSPPNNLSDEDARLLVATGFLRMAPDGTGGAVSDKLQARDDTIADTIRIVSSSLLGMTVGCAQCHDHRYDPIPQADYYRFRAIFQPAFDPEKWKSPAQRRVSLYTDADRDAAAKIEAEAKKLDAERTAKQQAFIQATFEQQLAELPEAIHEAARAAHATAQGKRTPEQQTLFRKHPKLNVTASSLYLYDRQAADQLKQMAAQAAELRSKKPQQEFVRALTETAGRIPPTHLLFRGNYDQPRREVQPAGLTVVSARSDLPTIPAQPAQTSSTGRRLALAKRLTHPNHPLTARVIVNRVWRHHFGRGLVETPGDFGVLGQPPSHPELLDWLAAEFIDCGWSLKHLHRLILNSNAWQQSVHHDPRRQQIDPDNTLFGSARLQRLDAEVLRDCILAISGQLNEKPFGPAVPVMADRVGRFVIGQENLNAGRPGAVIDMKGEQYRRSIYIQMRRSRPLAVLETFDQPPMAPNCVIRKPSTVSTQSLLMMNSDMLITFSRYFADRLARVSTERSHQIDAAFQLVCARPPDASERAAAFQFLEDQTNILLQQPAYQADAKQRPERTAEQEALAVMCQTLLGSNEFLYID